MYPNQPYPNFYNQSSLPSQANFPSPQMSMGNQFMNTGGMSLSNALAPFPRNRMYQKPLSRALANFNYYNFLEGTQKTLNTVNQIIPIVNQVTPMIRNAATVFKVANVLNTMPPSPITESVFHSTPQTNPITKQDSIEKPTLF